MKSISIALAVAITVACLSIMQTAAVPFSQPEPQVEQQMENEVPQHEEHWTVASVEETRPEEVLLRTKRQSHLSLCRYCCNCCSNKGCGFCCRF